MRYVKYVLFLGIIAGVGYTSGNLLANYLIDKKIKEKAKEKVAEVPTKYGSIVRLVTDGRTTCSGVVISNTVILTASHCVMISTPFGNMMNTSLIEIRDQSNVPTGVFAKPYGARIQLDHAILVGDFTAFKKRQVITGVGNLNKLTRHDVTMVSCGYPLGGELHCSTMLFRELYDFMWSASGLLLPGMSGGPVMLEDGTVVALNVAVLHTDSDHQMSIVSPVYNINMLYPKDK